MCRSIWNTFVLGLFLLTPSGTKGNSVEVTAADIAECGESIFGRVVCSSIEYYRECIVPGAETISAIKMHNNITDRPCVFLESFGFLSNSVWVTNGCSGEFYVCFTGVEVATYIPVDPVPTGPAPSGADVVEASTGWESNKVWIFILIGVVILVLFGGGLVLGCVVKRRHQREKSRRIAAKRQIVIDQKRKHRDEEEGTIAYPGVPIKSLTPSHSFASGINTRSFSEDFANNYDRSENDREGSICSSRSSNSGFTSVSCMTTGRIGRQAFNKRLSLDQTVLNGLSAPDLRSLRGFNSDVNGFTSKRTRPNKNSSISGSQTSLESIREIANRYQLYEIPLERRLSKQDGYKRPMKYNTVGSSGRSLPRSYENGAMTLPSRRTVTAMVHSVKPEVDVTENASSQSGEITAPGNYVPEVPRKNYQQPEVPPESHYQDPQSLTHVTSKASPNSNRPGDMNTPWSSIDEGIQKDMTDGPGDSGTETLDYKHNIPIYATVNKRNKRVELTKPKVPTKPVKLINGTSKGFGEGDSVTLKNSVNDDRSVDSNKPNEPYSHLTFGSFKPAGEYIYESSNFKQASGHTKMAIDNV